MKLTKSELIQLWENQEDIARQLLSHAQAELMATLEEDFMRVLFDISDNVNAKELFTMHDLRLVEMVISAFNLAGQIDDLVACSVPTTSETLNELLEKKLEDLG